jgi:serine/threonine-protein kinase
MTVVERDDLFIGRALLEQGLVGRDELADCVIEAARERRGGSAGRPLGVVLVDRGLISEDQLARVLARRVDPQGGAEVTQVADIALGQLFVASGYCTREQVEECIAEQARRRAAGERPGRLGEVLVERGFATSQQVMRVLAYQSKSIWECPSCRARYNVTSPKAGAVPRCKKDNQELRPVVARAAEPGGAREIARATNRAESDQSEIDHAVALYVRQKGIVRREHLRDAEQIQMELSHYGLVVPLAHVLRRLGALSWQQLNELEKVDFAGVIRKPGWANQGIPGYRVLGRIAAGGYATLYAAEPVFGGARVAIKLLHRDRVKDDRAVRRFKTEAALLRKLDHPGIVKGLDAGEHEGNLFLVMEHVDGRSLGQRIAESGALGVREALGLIRQVADALGYLHREGYLHRDVKPDNVLVDKTGRAKLCDLGFVVPVGVASASATGTEGYRSPEQAAGEEQKVGTDIYALGITLYALLTGFEPFGGAHSEETVAAQIEEGMPTPNLMMVQAPPGIVQLLRRMMHHERTRRFRSMPDLLAAMDALR